MDLDPKELKIIELQNEIDRITKLHVISTSSLSVSKSHVNFLLWRIETLNMQVIKSPDKQLSDIKEELMNMTYLWESAHNERSDAMMKLAEIEASRYAYATEFPNNDDGDPDVNNIHKNIRELKSKLERIINLPFESR